MVSASWYWRFVRIGSSGGYITEDVPFVSVFLQQFSELAAETTLETDEDRTTQRRLVAALKNTQLGSSVCFTAECALRCYISNHILRACTDLGNKFGSEHGFTVNDLLGFVLDDIDLTRSIRSSQPDDYEPFAAKILNTFDPEESSLSTWITILVRQQADLNRFMLEHGIFVQSDWAILNEKGPEHLRRILSQIYRLPDSEIDRACILLRSFHLIYRQQRRQKGAKGRCLPPTEEQLNDIRNKATLSCSTKEVMSQLLSIAAYLRQYQVAAKVGTPPGESLDRPEVLWQVEQAQIAEGTSDDEEDEQAALLHHYREQLVLCLDQAIEQTIDQRLTSLRRKPEKAEKYLPALNSYYCEKQKMTAIAVELGLKAQYEVTRLLEIDNFLARVRQHTLKCLRNSVLELAQEYANPDQLQHLDGKIEAILDEQLDRILTKNRANLPDPCFTESLFVQRLCLIVQRLL